ncbi:putative phage terminase small subunit [Komagataeibacter diospyri]|uniref:P27 family phage terminase small subunit n=1 Tax=Komagataeibacter diospyri TaxID=1932662 RepID=UPI00113A8DDB|nr:P27 family phage terminase small subunit [Komagataeibacter diospyri]GCE89674.1 putative phage terminase small subunit [Komagataeibacter diospyri]
MARPRKPTHLKVVTGTAQACRANPKEPKPKRARPMAPTGLSKRAKAVWTKAARLLDGMGVLTTADGLALEGLCEAVADELEARASLARPIVTQVQDGVADDETPIMREIEVAAAGAQTYVTIGKSGPMVRMRPEVAAIADANRRVAMWLAKFGLTPADRSKVGAEGQQNKNAFQQIG